MSPGAAKNTEQTTAPLHVRILSPTQTLYDGNATSLTATNKIGVFDVLPGHANFFSLLTQCSVVVNSGFQNLTFPVTKGILKVTHNNLTLFVDIEPSYAAVTEKIEKQERVADQ